jgi:arabinofuranosyltransferase
MLDGLAARCSPWQKWDPRLRPGLLVSALVAIGWVAFLIPLASTYKVETPFGRTWGVMDDVFVSASFARTFVEGNGLVWYPNAPRVEGFSNPLWVLLLAGLHALPSFSEDRLGAYVFAVNALILIALAFVVFTGLSRAVRHDQPRHSVWRWSAAAFPAFAGASLVSRSADGFEVALVALLSTWAFVEALAPAERMRVSLVGALIGLAFWTRMDGVVSCACAALLVGLKLRDPRRIARFAVLPLAMVAALLLARRVYYGEWLPNTYYLKLARWPLDQRIAYGVFQNIFTLAAQGLLLMPFAAVAWRRLDPKDRPLLLALAGPFLTVGYSTWSGGDFIWPAFGYDRHGAAGIGLLIFGVGAVFLRARLARREWPIASLTVAALVLIPAFVDMRGWNAAGFRQLFHVRMQSEFDRWFKTDTVYRGKLLKEFTLPRARIAVCQAGALVYFSHRGGVDVLGKVEPYVANLPATAEPPAERRCWREIGPSGHNKEDLPGLFALRKPDLSDVPPPLAETGKYVALTYRGRSFFGLRESPLILWDRVSLVTGISE